MGRSKVHHWNGPLFYLCVRETDVVSDIVIGMPSTSPGELENKIHTEHMRYLVAELNVKVSASTSWKMDNSTFKSIMGSCHNTSRAQDKVRIFISIMLISLPNPMFDHLLESPH